MIHVIPIICIVLAAICKAAADTLKDHFFVSVFKNKNQDFWNPDKSWNHGLFFGKYHGDAWHLFNSAMIVFFTVAVCFHSPYFYHGKSYEWLEFILTGIIFVNTFNLFYNHIFR